MARYGVTHTITYVAWNTADNAGETGDSANHTLRWVKDGTSGAPSNSPAEVDATNAPGLYKLVLTAAECQCAFGTLGGVSSTSDVSIMPASLSFIQSIDVDSISGSTSAADNVEANIGNLDAPISTVDTVVDAILVDTGTTLPATLTTIDGKVDTVDGNVDAILVDTGTTLPATLAGTLSADMVAISGSAAAANGLENVFNGVGNPIYLAGGSDLDSVLNTIDVNVDAIVTSTGTTIPGTLTTIDGKIDTIDGNVDSILTDTATTIPGLISGLNDISTGDLDTALATYDSPTNAEMLAAFSTTDGLITTVDGVVDSILTDTGTTLPATLAGTLSADVVSVSGDTTAADNLEAALDGTGGVNLNLNELNLSQVNVTQTGASEPAVKIQSIGSAGNGIVINATDAAGSGIVLNTGLYTIYLDGSDLKTMLSTLDTNVDSVLVDTGTTLPGTLTTIEGKVDTVDANVDAVLVDTGTTIPAQVSGLNNISTADVDAALATYDAPTKAELDAAHATTDALITTVDGVVDSILTDTGTTIPAQLDSMSGATFDTATDSLEAIRDQGDSAWATGGGGTAPTVEEIRTEMDSNSTQLAAIVEDTGTTIPAQITGLNNISTGDLDTALATYDAPTNAEMVAAFSTTDGLVTTVDGVVDSILTDTGTTLPATLATIDGNVDAILVDTDTTIPGLIAGLNDISTGDLDTAFATYDGPTNAEMLAAHSTTDGLITTVDSVVDALSVSGLSELSSGTAQAGAATTITLEAGEVAIDDYYNDTRVVLTGGTGAGQSRMITDYGGMSKQATVYSAWITNPDATTTYEIQASDSKSVGLDGAVAVIDANVDLILSDTNTTLPATLSAIAADVTTIDGIVDDILQDTGTTIPANQITVADIWDEATSGLVTVGSIGKYLMDNLDVVLSTRSTFDPTSDTVDIGKISGDSGAADNLEAILDDTGGQIKLESASGRPGLEIGSSIAVDSPVEIRSTEDFSPGVIIQTIGAASPSITFSTADGIGLFGHGIMAAQTSTMTEAGSLGKLLVDKIPNLDAAISSRSTFDETSDTVIVGTNNDKTGYSLGDIDGVTDTVLREMLLAFVAGKTSIVDNGADSTITFYKQDGLTGRYTVTYDATGAWTSTAII